MRKHVLVLALLILLTAPVLAQAEALSQLRIGQFALDIGAVDVYINGELPEDDVSSEDEDMDETQGLAFGDMTTWRELPVDTYQITIVPVGMTLDDALLDLPDMELTEDAWVTIALIGSQELNTLAAQVLMEDYSAISPGETRVSVFHAMAGILPLSLLDNNNPLVRGLGYPGFYGPESDGFHTVDLVARRYHLHVNDSSRERSCCVLHPGDREFQENNNYFVAMIGSLDHPQYAIVGTDMDDLMEDE